MANPISSTRWQRLKLIVEVIEVRLRFIAVLVATGLFICYWDTIKNYWDKYTRPAEVASGALPADKEFYCPMHPKVVRTSLDPDGSVPKCPICGMPLSERTKGQAEPLPPGVTGRVQLSPDRIQMAGIETAEVKYQPITKQITTVGTVAWDESRLSRVVSRVSGYVERLYVDKTFVKVEQGDRLAEIYSPDLYSTAQEMLLSARGNVAKDMAASARRRLKLFGVSDREIDDIVAAGVATPRLVIRSPQSGLIMRKNIVAGSRVDDGMVLLEIADLSDVWIEADVFERDIALVREGQPIEAVVAAMPNRVFNGKVALVYPQMDVATRTNRVRFQLANPGFDLRPGMYATVRIRTPLGEIEPFKSLLAHRAKDAEKTPGAEASPFRTVSTGAGASDTEEVLTVPQRAVIDTGTKQIVYVERAPGVFEGVEVVLGPRSGELYPVAQGLKAGDRVAAAGSFLIDAETRLNPAAAATFVGAGGSPQSGRSGAKPGATAGLSSSAERTVGQANRGTPGAKPAPAPAPAEPKPRTASAAVPVQPSGAALDNIAKLPQSDRTLALAQGTCPITGAPLGSMGVPPKVMLNGQPVFLCCKGCSAAAQSSPGETLEKVTKLKNSLHATKH